MEPLPDLLQISIRFFIHPLPSRKFGRRYLGLTRSIRPLLDSVGFTLLYRLAFFSSLGAAFLAVEIGFTRLMKVRIINPSTSLLGRAYQLYLALW